MPTSRARARPGRRDVRAPHSRDLHARLDRHERGQLVRAQAAPPDPGGRGRARGRSGVHRLLPGPDRQAQPSRSQNEALKYAGDTLRRRGARTTCSSEDAGDQRVVLNSTNYWDSRRPTDGRNEQASTTRCGTPCDTKFLDVKATDDRRAAALPLDPALPEPQGASAGRGPQGRRARTACARSACPRSTRSRSPSCSSTRTRRAATNPAAIVGASRSLDVDQTTLPQAEPPASPLPALTAWQEDGRAGVNLNSNDELQRRHRREPRST